MGTGPGAQRGSSRRRPRRGLIERGIGVSGCEGMRGGARTVGGAGEADLELLQVVVNELEVVVGGRSSGGGVGGLRSVCGMGTRTAS